MRRQLEATIEHADIRGLFTALHRSVAGLPLSSFGDRLMDAHIARSRVPLTVCRRIALPEPFPLVALCYCIVGLLL
jgi:hypothetical protein